MRSSATMTRLAAQRNAPPRILIVDDEATDAEGLGEAVDDWGYDLKVVHNSFTALDIAKQWKPQVAILDVKMPGMNGLVLCQKLRECADDPFIIFVTSEATYRMRRLCLKFGDDYITKPYSSEELLLRVQNKLRRIDPARTGGQGANTMISPIHQARGDVAPIDDDFTPTEARLLNALIAGEGETVSRDTLLRDVWDDEVNDNTLDITVRRLRMKIEPDPRHPRIIITVRRAGYRLDLAEWRRRSR
jgi:DNA-binding response OmpR family regulator